MSLTSFFKSVSVLAQSVDQASQIERAQLVWEEAQFGVSSQTVQVDVREEWGVVVLAPKPIPNTKTVCLREGDSSYRLQVIAAREQPSGFELELAYVDSGRRRETRIEVGGGATIGSPLGRDEQSVRAEILNVSAGGLQVLCDEAFSAGEAVRVIGDGVERLCRVCYCLKISGGYRVGLQFRDPHFE